jgi:hypothetical protein
VDDVLRRVQSGLPDRIAHRQSLDEDADQGLDQGRPDAGSPRRTQRQHQVSVHVEGDHRAHHRRDAVAGREVTHDQFALAEHRVEVHAVAGQPAARAEAQRCRYHASVSGRIDDADVRGIAEPARPAEDLREAHRPFGRGHPA